MNILLESITFLLLTHHFGLPAYLRAEYSPIIFLFGQYAGMVTNLLFSVSITSLIEWYLTRKKDKLLFLIFISPFLSLLFIVGQWVFTQQLFMYQEGLHRYLVIPQIGICLFLASLLSYVYQKHNFSLRLYLPLIALLLVIFFISKIEIARVFNTKIEAGAELKAQKLMQNIVVNAIPKERIKNNMLFFIKTPISSEPINKTAEIFGWRDLTYWMHIQRSYLTNKATDSCIAMTWDLMQLQKMATTRNDKKGFIFQNGGNKEAVCLNEGSTIDTAGQFYNLEDFYAYELDKTGLNSITEEMISNLTFIPNQ